VSEARRDGSAAPAAGGADARSGVPAPSAVQPRGRTEGRAASSDASDGSAIIDWLVKEHRPANR
jgi:hypothetical protein